jgi:hypothetical protein
MKKNDEERLLNSMPVRVLHEECDEEIIPEGRLGLCPDDYDQEDPPSGRTATLTDWDNEGR